MWWRRSAAEVLLDLRLRERGEYGRASAQRRRRGWVVHHVDYDDDRLLRSPRLGWRVDQVCSALRGADSAVVRKLAEHLAGLEVHTVAQALAAAYADMVLVWGGSVLLGAGAGPGRGAAAGDAPLRAGAGTGLGSPRWVVPTGA